MSGELRCVPCGICGTPTPMTGTKRCDRCWELEGRIHRNPEIARRILASAASTSAPGVHVPDGWRLVPLKPTPEMWRAWDQAPFNEDGDIERNNAWGAMLAAAPEAAIAKATGEAA